MALALAVVSSAAPLPAAAASRAELREKARAEEAEKARDAEKARADAEKARADAAETRDTWARVVSGECAMSAFAVRVCVHTYVPNLAEIACVDG